MVPGRRHDHATRRRHEPLINWVLRSHTPGDNIQELYDLEVELIRRGWAYVDQQARGNRQFSWSHSFSLDKYLSRCKKHHGILYGMGAKSFAEQLECSLDDANEKN